MALRPRNNSITSIDRLQRLKIQARSTVPVRRKVAQPQHQFSELFHDVQMRSIQDSKRFVDAIPLKEQKIIQKAYDREKNQKDFDVMEFLGRYFIFPDSKSVNATPSTSMSGYISELWPHLTRSASKNTGSLQALPYPYVVPGGRFDEFFYWDSYFIALGLTADKQFNLVESIAKNMTYLLRSNGFIPTANRSYLMTRSQPPYFARLVQLLEESSPSTLAKNVPYMVFEYRFWMKDRKKLSDKNPTAKRVVRMPDGTVLNRYYDEMADPRPESYPEDLKTAEQAMERRAAQVYLDVRAAAESGWDFSSRWFGEGNNLASIRTSELIPVDLNCLLYELEITIARGYRQLKQPVLAKRFEQAAAQRARTINTYCYDEKTGFYYDFHSPSARRSGHKTLASVYPLTVGIASKKQAAAVAATIERDFLRSGGVVTTLVHSSQQWDAPNGWAPLQWETIIGLRKYGFNDLADTIKERFIHCAQHTFATKQKMVEKYNVEHVGKEATGGEYALQDGFGWTNGVVQALLKDLDEKRS